MLRARQKIGKYRILGRIASGPLADVYRAYDTIQKIRVALKIPKTGGETGADEFLHEVQVATKLRHPNILSVLNASYIDDHFVIAMELGDESLADRIVRRTSTVRALDLAGQAIAALAHAHEHKIIHCDIKPENFILFPGNQLKLADFGFAKLSLRTLKASGSGTIDYISPEQAMGDQNVGPQTDTYALGCVLYEMLVGEPPYTGPTAQAVLGQIIAGDTASATKKRASVPANVDAALRCALEKLPADRFTSAQDFVRALGDEHFRYGELATAGAGAETGGSA